MSGKRVWIFISLMAGTLAFLLLTTSSAVRESLLRQARGQLAAQSQEKAADLYRWRADQALALMAIAEQRQIRENISMLAARHSPLAGREAFIEALNALCQAFLAEHPPFESLTLRDLSGHKIAGVGAAWDSVAYPTLRLRIQQLRQAPAKEKWTVPIRDAQAEALGYVVADLNFAAAAILKAVPDHLSLCLRDSAGNRIWQAPDQVEIPPLDPASEFFLSPDGAIYLTATAPIPGTNWLLTLAEPRKSVLTDEYDPILHQLILAFVVGFFSLGLIVFWFARRGPSTSPT